MPPKMIAPAIDPMTIPAIAPPPNPLLWKHKTCKKSRHSHMRLKIPSLQENSCQLRD